jgi:hypothetical protein
MEALLSLQELVVFQTSLSKNFGWEYQQHGLEVLEHGNFSGSLEYYEYFIE